MAENRNTNASTYNDDSIQTLAWNEHIRQRPGMYVGRFGDGSQSDDGMYVLIKEVMDNSIDEYMMGHGKTIEVTIDAASPSAITDAAYRSTSFPMRYRR